MIFSSYLYLDRIRPACLPPKASILSQRISEIYRLVRDSTLKVFQAAAYKPKSYVLLNTEYCHLMHSVNLSNQTAFCAQGDDASGNHGDPFVVKVKEEKGNTPIYVVAIDAIHLNDRLGIFLELYPYVQWISNIISENDTKETIQKSRSENNLAHV